MGSHLLSSLEDCLDEGKSLLEVARLVASWCQKGERVLLEESLDEAEDLRYVAEAKVGLFIIKDKSNQFNEELLHGMAHSLMAMKEEHDCALNAFICDFRSNSFEGGVNQRHENPL